MCCKIYHNIYFFLKVYDPIHSQKMSPLPHLTSSKPLSLMVACHVGRSAGGTAGVCLLVLTLLGAVVTGRPTMDRVITEDNLTIMVSETFHPPPILCRSHMGLVSVE